MRKAVHVTIRGIVQGVGYRAFVEREASALGFDGWVRNRRDGSVEAVLEGEDSQIAKLRMRLDVGPVGSHVTDLRISDFKGVVEPGFQVRPTE